VPSKGIRLFQGTGIWSSWCVALMQWNWCVQAIDIWKILESLGKMFGLFGGFDQDLGLSYCSFPSPDAALRANSCATLLLMREGF
jgi:hypothetical protein